MKQHEKDRVVIVIPALNEEKTIAAVVKGAMAVAPVLVVSDGSTDATAAVAAGSGAQVLELERNVGVDRALYAGFQEAYRLEYDVVATIDADGQHDTALLNQIILPVTSGRFEMCHSCRTDYCRLMEWLLRKYSFMMHGLGDILSGFKAFRLRTVFAPHAQMVSRPSLGTALPWAAVDDGSAIAEVVITVDDRDEGDTPRVGGVIKANYRVAKALLRLIYWDLKSFCRNPQRFITLRHRNRHQRRVRLSAKASSL